MKKRINVMVLSVIMLLMSVLGVFAAETYEEWEDDWTDAAASAFGYASCTEGGADAESNCYPTGSVIGTSVYVSGSFTYKEEGTTKSYILSDYDTDSTYSNSFADVYFTTPTGCVGVDILYEYTASYSAYYHGAVYEDSYSGSGDVWAVH